MRRWKNLGRVWMVAVFGFMYVPIAVLIAFSFNESKSRNVWAGFSLRWYKNLLGDEMILQALGVFIDTLLICSCSALIMLLTPASLTDGLQGMDLLQTAMRYHIGEAGVIFVAVILWLFSFSTFIGILFYARSNVAYLFGDNWSAQTLYKVLALVMLFIGGLAAYTFVWDLGDIGIGLMTIFNMMALIPLSPKVIESLKDYEQNHRHDKTL